MARDDTARDDDLPVDRRSFLGAVGAGAASAVGVGALANASDAVSASDYRTITVPAGDTKLITVGSGETFENVLIDMTAEGASAKILASGDGWTVRNVAFKGNHPGGHYLMIPGVPNEDGHGLVENVYMGDGQTPRTGKGGIWVDGSTPHRGTITFRNLHVAHMIDNGLYGTGSGTSGVGGVVHVEDSYFDSNNISNIRVGSIDGRTCHVRNCVVKTDTARPCGASCSSPGAVNSRGVWAWWGPVEVHDSDIAGPRVEQDSRAGDPEIISKNSRWGSAADTDRVPEGVPMTAEEAASGQSGSSGTTTDPSDGTDEETDDGTDAEGTVLELVAGDDTASVTYEFTVEGGVSKRDSAESADEITDNGDGTVTVSGISGNGYGDSFLVDGHVTSMNLDESKWTIRYGGQEVSVDDFVLPNTLVIDGRDSPRAVSEYTFRVSGSARKSDELGSVNGYDTVSDGEISGRVVGGVDGYRFSGEITGFTLDGPANVRVEDDS